MKNDVQEENEGKILMSLVKVTEPKYTSESPSWTYENFSVAKKTFLEKADIIIVGIK